MNFVEQWPTGRNKRHFLRMPGSLMALWSPELHTPFYRGAIQIEWEWPKLCSWWGVTPFGGPYAARNWTGRRLQCLALTLGGFLRIYVRSPSGRVWNWQTQRERRLW